MRVVTAIDELEPVPRAIALGAFDGVHLGHRGLIDRAAERARELGVRSSVATFDPLPLELLQPEAAPRRLSSVEHRAELIAERDVDELIVIPFTLELSRLTPAAFVEQVLADAAHAVHVVVGEDYRFGSRAAGEAATLAELGQQHGFGVTTVGLITVDGERVSSSWIRELVRQGEVERAARLLGRDPWLEGFVERGFARGQELGVPTANLAWPRGRVVPGHGIYAGYATVGSERARYRAAISVGRNPTFDDVEGTVVEAHLLDFAGDIYDEPMRIDFTRFLRHELAFESIDELVSQMWHDIAQARALPL